MKGHGTKLGRKMNEAVVALLTQRNIEEAARTVGVSSATLMRWSKIPEFQSVLREARRDAFRQTIGRLQQGASAAATALLKMLVDPGVSGQVRVRAAECILNHATKALEIEDIEARMVELERVAETAKQGPR